MFIRSLPLLLLHASLVAAELAPVHNFLQTPGSLHIKSPAVPQTPWTVAGEHAAIFGRQNGKFEAWVWPNKILSDFSIHAELADYPVPIDVNALAAQIDVTPAETVITYSHAAFTIRQHMFAARGPDRPSAGAAVVFEIDSVRPLELRFSFTPEMLRMWPAPNSGRPNGEWVAKNGNGVYVLHTDNPNYSALVAMPRTRPGIMVPYQEHPQTYPLELKLSFDPKRDRQMLFPLVFAITDRKDPLAQAVSLIAEIPNLYSAVRRYYEDFLARRLTIETPDTRLNESLKWAEVAIDQMQVKFHDEIGLVAGYYESADSARPGYAWFFGRDTLWTTYAINSYGDAALTRRALDFLIRRQRADGKIMHEFSQSADQTDWASTPYFYASADAVPLLVMAMGDYVRTTGDLDYLRNNWSAVKKAYAFTRAHESSDGITNNTEGTGWVESWPPVMPYQEIYLAALDCQSAQAMAKLARLVNEPDLANAAAAKAKDIAAKLPAEYFDEAQQFYAFSRNQDGTRDNTASIYPAVAWWDGTLSLPKAAPMLRRWASDEFSTDWGTRDISNRTPFYDPISYHQGSIWPLFTGWVSLAEYRAGRTLSGYAHLMQNANLTWSQDLGSVTELLSGDFFQPLGRSSSHQMWSSAMIIAPLLRGLFGLECDVPNRLLRVSPHLPADWNGARLHNVPFGNSWLNIDISRVSGQLQIEVKTNEPQTFCLASVSTSEASCTPQAARTHVLRLPLAPVELSVPASVPNQGARTSQMKVLREEYGTKDANFELSGPGDSTFDLPVRFNRPNVKAQGGELLGSKLRVRFPAGSGYQQQIVTFRW